jgi:uncharacterized membrane protein YkgB
MPKSNARLPGFLARLDPVIAGWMERHGITVTRIALGTIFLWFGALKFFPGMSPAEDLAARTMMQLSGGRLGPEVSLPLLAAWESAIGLGLLAGRLLRTTLLLLFIQLPGTLMPLLLFPEETFTRFPLAPTLEGQYIIKSLVLVGAALVIGSTVRHQRK